MICVAAATMWVTAGCGRRAVDLMDRADALLDDRPDSAKVLYQSRPLSVPGQAGAVYGFGDNRKRKDEYVSGAICKEL